MLIFSQFKGVFNKAKRYEVDYIFYHKTQPHDALNESYMAKMIEDCIFEDDKHDIITKVSLSSRKSKAEFVEITVNEL